MGWIFVIKKKGTGYPLDFFKFLGRMSFSFFQGGIFVFKQLDLIEGN